MANILMVVSAADSLTMRDGTEHPTGYWAEELVVSHRTLRNAGHTVHIATPGGSKPTVDEVSLAAESAGGQDRADSFRLPRRDRRRTVRAAGAGRRRPRRL